MNGSDLPPALAQRAARGELAHAYLLTGAPDETLEAAARAVAAAMVCTGEGDRPCGTCRACRKAAQGIHPDIIAVAPEAGRDLTVAQVRQARSDAYIRPNEAPRKVYLFQRAYRMNQSAQNALLKVLEEGPPYAAFLLLSPNGAALLPTVRSRCEAVQVAAPAPKGAMAEGLARKGEELAGLLLSGDRWGLVSWCVPQERARREDVLTVLESARGALLTYRDKRTTPRAVELARQMGEIIAAGAGNLNVGAIWGWVLALC